MKSIKKQIIFILMFIAFFIIGTKVYAADATLSVSSNNVTTGATVNITVGVQSAEVWKLNLSTSGGTLSGTTTGIIDAPGAETTKNVANATFTASEPGIYTITLSGSIASSADVNNSTSRSVNKQVSITVTAPVQPSPDVKPSPSTPTNPSPVVPTFSNVNETVYATTDVFVRSSYSTSSSSLGQLKKGESVVRVGASTTKVNGYYWSKVTYNGKTGYIASNYLTTTKPTENPSPSPSSQPEEKSKDATLKSLAITGLEFTPAFNSDITSYVVNTKENITEVEVLAEVNDSKAKLEISGDKELKEGENLIVVKVTAEDGTTKNYEIKLINGKQKIPLNAFVIMGIKENGEQIEIKLADPIVSENTVEYIINLEEWLKSINILGSLNNETYQYEGTGAFDLVVGENKYTIILKELQENAETNSIEYKITINNPEKVIVAVETNGMNYKLIIAISAIVVVTILAITGLIVYYKKQNKVEYAKTDYSFLKKDEDSQNKENEQNVDVEDKNVSDNDEEGKRKGGKHF